MKHLLLISAFFITLSCKAQDVIYLRNNKQLTVAIANLNKHRVIYYELPNVTGKSFRIKTSDILMVRYAYGKVVLLNNADIKPTDTLPTSHYIKNN